MLNGSTTRRRACGRNHAVGNCTTVDNCEVKPSVGISCKVDMEVRNFAFILVIIVREGLLVRQKAFTVRKGYIRNFVVFPFFPNFDFLS